jgi:c-di-GMP-binding flagellar brake protein YcgR
MSRQSVETINGKRLRELVWDQIQSRRLCRIAIANSDNEWITLLLDIRGKGQAPFLIIDGVPGFEKALSAAGHDRIHFEFLGAEGVPCRFQSQVARCCSKEIWVRFPQKIVRDQKRAFYRLEAPVGAEISFSLETGRGVKAQVRDYSMGGLSFYVPGKLPLMAEEEPRNLIFRLPEASSIVSIQIAQAVVRRVERNHWRERPFCALEIVEIAEAMREKLGQQIFLHQRTLIRRVRRTPRGTRAL